MINKVKEFFLGQRVKFENRMYIVKNFPTRTSAVLEAVLMESGHPSSIKTTIRELREKCTDLESELDFLDVLDDNFP